MNGSMNSQVVSACLSLLTHVSPPARACARGGEQGPIDGQDTAADIADTVDIPPIPPLRGLTYWTWTDPTMPTV